MYLQIKQFDIIDTNEFNVKVDQNFNIYLETVQYKYFIHTRLCVDMFFKPKAE